MGVSGRTAHEASRVCRSLTNVAAVAVGLLRRFDASPVDSERSRWNDVHELLANDGDGPVAVLARPPRPAPERVDAGRGPGHARAILATIGTLGVAAALEAAVYGHGGHAALSDIPGRFFAWNVHPSLLPYRGSPIEYPVVIGYVAWMTGWFGQTVSSFFIANAALSAVLAIVMTLMLMERGGQRIWRWAFAVPLALYAFHNWDLVAMVPAMAGLIAFDRGRNHASGMLLALGASAKVFPGLFLPPLAVVRWRAGDRRGALALVGAFGITTVVLNGPVAWWSWSAWTYPLSFQGGRAATWGSLWYWLLRTPGAHALVGGNLHEVANVLAFIALVGALVLISVLAVRRRLDAMAIGAAVVGAFLLSNKVYSPNYDLWLVPFFVVLPIPRRVWLAFAASALGVFVLVYGHFHIGWSRGVVEALLPPFVVVRAVTIVAVVVTALLVSASSRPFVTCRARR